MKTIVILPRRAFNSPCIEFVNFKDGTHINLISLKIPFKNGMSYAIHDTTPSPYIKGGLFKTYEDAKLKFEIMYRVHSHDCEIKNKGVIDHSKSYSNGN